MSAIRTVEELSTDPEFAGYYDYEKAHQRELEDYRETGYDEGHTDGFEEGAKEQAIQTAKSLLNSGMPIEEISKHTKLSIEEINAMKK